MPKPAPSRLVPHMAAYLAGIFACIALAGWILGIPALTSVVPGLVSMKANTAICFLLLSGALYAAAECRWREMAGLACSCGSCFGFADSFRICLRNQPWD